MPFKLQLIDVSSNPLNRWIAGTAQVRWFSGIRVQLLALIVLTSAPLVGFIFANASRDSRAAIDRASEELSFVVGRVAFRQEILVQTGRDLTSVVAAALAERGVGSPGCSAFFRALRNLETGGWRFIRADRDGWIVCAGDGSMPFNIAQRPHFAAAAATGRAVVGTYAPYPFDGSATLPIAQALYTAGGQFDGVVVAAATVAWIDEAIESLPLPAGLRVQVADRDGNLIADAAGSGAPPLLPEHWLGSAEAARDGKIIERDSLLLAVRDVDGGGLCVVAARARADVVAGPHRELLWDLFAASAVVMAGGLLASAFAERRIAGRIRRLAAVALRLSQGDLTARSDLPHDQDELGDLAYSFDRMASDLERQHGHLAAREAEFRHLALHDPLTGLTNRRGFHEVLDRRISLLDAAQRPFALLLLDLDGFKVVNDSLGHDSGDALLIAAAERLRSSLRGRDVIARLAGDEFAVILNGATDMDDGYAVVVDRLIESLAQPYRIADRDIVCTATIGVALFPQHGRSWAGLMKAADVALYAGKAAGRCTWRLSSSNPDACERALADDRLPAARVGRWPPAEFC